MAVRREDLNLTTGSVVVRFPVERARGRRRRLEMQVRRRRLVAAIGALAVAVLVTWGGDSPQLPTASRTRAPSAVVVEPGQTLWDLASRYAPSDADPRAYIQELESLNHLDGSLQAGERIILPK